MITMTSLAKWCDHVARVTVGPSLTDADRLAFQAKPTVQCDAAEVVRRALAIAKVGHGYVESDENCKAHVEFARAAAVELEFAGKDVANA